MKITLIDIKVSTKPVTVLVPKDARFLNVKHIDLGFCAHGVQLAVLGGEESEPRVFHTCGLDTGVVFENSADILYIGMISPGRSSNDIFVFVENKGVQPG